MASAQTQPLKRGVEVSNKLDPDATLVRVVYTHRPGLHCDLCACVDAQRLTIVRSDLRRAGHLRVHRFWVVAGSSAGGGKLEHAALTPLSLAVRDAVVDPGLWARWHGVENARARAARDAARETTASGVAGNGVGGRARTSVPATPGALRDVLLKLLATEVDLDELEVRLVRRNTTSVTHSAPRESAFFEAEASLRVDAGADAAAAARAFAAGSGAAPAGLVAIADTKPATKPLGGAPTTSPERDARPGASHVPRAESAADLCRFQTTSGLTNREPASPAPAPASPSPLSPAPYAPRLDPRSGMVRSASAEMRSPSSLTHGEGESGALFRGRLSPAPTSTSRRAGHAIPHASSIADLQAMQAAQGVMSPRADAAGDSPTGSRPASRLGLRGPSPPFFQKGEGDVEMDEAPAATRPTFDERRATPGGDDGYSLDGTSVAVVSREGEVSGHDGHGTVSTRARSENAPSSLFGEGRFPSLPPPRRDASESEYRLLRELGRGLCGTVYLAEEKRSGTIVAFKVMRKQKLVDVGEATHASEERRLHERVSSGPFINRLLASFQDPWALFLVLEYAPCGDLFQAMNFHGLPSRVDATVYATQVALALGHLHALGYVYRDLKPENILLHPHGSAQLADFGMAKRIAFGGGDARGAVSSCASLFAKKGGVLASGGVDAEARTYTICGTAQYMSPEVLLHRGCRFEADLWALGVFVYELVTGDTPFSVASGSRQELYRRLMSHDPDAMAMPSAVDSSTASLVRALLKNDERARLGAGGNWDRLFAHEWFGGLNVDGVRRGSIVPALSPRRRNVVTDPALRKVLDRGDKPWRRGAIIEDAKTRALFDRF